MLKFENLANVGDIIKAFDFQPMPDRPDSFLVGRVIEKGDIMHPKYGVMLYRGYTVEVMGDKSVECGYTKGEIAYVPFENGFIDYDERVSVIATQEEIEMLVAYEEEETFH